MTQATNSGPRCLHVYKDYFPVLGGIENHIRVLCHGLIAGGRYRPRVLTTNESWRTERFDDGGVPIVRAGRLATVASTPVSVALWREMARTETEITHLHFPYPVGEMAHLVLGRARHLVITYHSDIVRQTRLLRLYGPILTRVLAAADRIIVASPDYLTSSPYLAPYKEKARVIPYGIDLDRFGSADDRRVRELRSRWPDGPIVLFVGRFRYYKGLEYLVRAARQIDGTVVLAGSGPSEQALREEIKRLGVGSRVLLTGDVPDEDLPAVYQACDVFVLPASHRSEAFGIVVAEAMAAGKPVVTTKLGTGTTFVNQHGESGLTVAPRDPEALAAAVNRLLGDDEFRARLAAGARQRARAELGLTAMVDRVTAVYDEVLSA